MGDERISRAEAARRTAGIAALCGLAVAWLVALPYARGQGPQIVALLGAAICAALRGAAGLAVADRRAGRGAWGGGGARRRRPPRGAGGVAWRGRGRRGGRRRLGRHARGRGAGRRGGRRAVDERRRPRRRRARGCRRRARRRGGRRSAWDGVAAA